MYYIYISLCLLWLVDFNPIKDECKIFNYQLNGNPEHFILVLTFNFLKGSRGSERMVVGFTTTYVISAYHH